MNDSLISIILPTYNSEKTIKRTIESIKNQSYKNKELIIINDGSNDETKKICEKEIENTSYKLINIKNSGVSKARNIGLENATGKYITFIDSDDLYEREFLRKIVREIESGYDLVSISYKNFGLNEKKFTAGNSFETDNVNIYLERLKDSYLFNQIWNKIYKLDIIKENRISFDEKISIAEDLKFNIEYIFKCKKMFYLNDPLYFYRVTGVGLGFKYRTDASVIKLDLVKKLELNYIEHNFDMEYIYKNYIHQYFSYFSNILDCRSSLNKKEKKFKIKKIIKSDEFNRFINSVNISGTKQVLLFEILKTRNLFFIYNTSKLANIYDKVKKKKNFGL